MLFLEVIMTVKLYQFTILAAVLLCGCFNGIIVIAIHFQVKTYMSTIYKRTGLNG